MCKNSIFANPIGWAEGTVGTRYRYLFMIIMTIFLGLLIIAMVILVSPNWQTWLIISILVFSCSIQLPLFYLVALRKLMLERHIYSRRADLAATKKTQR